MGFGLQPIITMSEPGLINRLAARRRIARCRIPRAQAHPGGSQAGSPSARLSLLLLGLCFVASRVAAQAASEDALLPSSAFEDDPIGVEQPLQATRAPAAEPEAADSLYGPKPHSHRATAGQILAAVGSVRETRRAVTVELSRGLALVKLQLQLENSANSRAEAQLSLRVPRFARATGLRVCLAQRCRGGQVQPASLPSPSAAYDAALLARKTSSQEHPIALVQSGADEQGPLLILHAAPVQRDHPLVIELSYLVPAPIAGGVAWLWLPAAGMDPRVAPAELTVRSDSLVELQVDGRAATAPITLPPWSDALISGRLGAQPALSSSAVHYPCEDGRCYRLWAAAPPAAPQPLDLIVALDASPSMEGPARSRLPAALAALLAIAPSGTTVRALSFAGHTQTLIAEPEDVHHVALDRFQSLLFDLDLGSATRVEAALDAIAPWLKSKAQTRRTMLLILGDGDMTTGDARPFERARRLGLQVSAIDLSGGYAADGWTEADAALARGVALTGGVLIQAGEAARIAELSGHEQPLEAALSAVFARVAQRRIRVDGGDPTQDGWPLRAGEQRVVEGRMRASARASLTWSGHTAHSATVPRGDELSQALAVARGMHTDLTPPAFVALDAADRRHASDDFPPHSREPRRRSGACDPRGPASRIGALNLDDNPIVLAHERACARPSEATASELKPGQGMPASPLLEMLRKRIIPVARDCFRRDRAGRPDYELRALFRFELARREVISARVEGDIEPPLRACLLRAVDRLAVPFFAGTVIVSYPLRTQREALPVQIELQADLAGELDATLERAGATRSPPSLP